MQSNIATCVFFQGRLKEVREGEEEGSGSGGGGATQSEEVRQDHVILNNVQYLPGTAHICQLMLLTVCCW